MGTVRLPCRVANVYLVGLVLCTYATLSYSTLDPVIVKKIDRFINSVMACRHVPGLTLAIVRDGRAVLEKGYGLADIERNISVTKRTLFPIGSCSKSFTSTVLAMLLQNSTDSSVTWDTPIAKILGNDFRLNDEILTRHTNIRDILAHKTGMPGYWLSIMAGTPKNVTRADLVRRLRFQKSEYPFRTKFLYNNQMYMLAGYVTERMDPQKASWEDIVRRHILNTLGMTTTTFVEELKENTDMVSPYAYIDGRTQKLDRVLLEQVLPMGPAGSVVSTAEDMSKWMLFHLNKLREPHLRELYDNQNTLREKDLHKPLFPASDVTIAYALGWFSGVYRGYRRIAHSGSILSYKSRLWLLPDRNLGIFTSVNGPYGKTSSTVTRLVNLFVADVILEGQSWLDDTSGCTYPSPWKNSKPTTNEPTYAALNDDQPPLPLENYLGLYRHPGFGAINIILNETNYHLDLRMGRFLQGTLYYDLTSKLFNLRITGKYWFHRENIPIKFRSKDENGKIDILELPLDEPYKTTKGVAFKRNARDSDYGPGQIGTCSSFCLCTGMASISRASVLGLVLSQCLAAFVS